jgi:DNA-binding MarR family transcriptional regulator
MRSPGAQSRVRGRRLRDPGRHVNGARNGARNESPWNAASESVSLWFRLLSCHAMILAELRQRERSAGVTLARFDLLASLHREDGQTLAGLSRALLVTAGNVTGLVDRAERDRVVERRPDPADRRVARVWLTDHGRALIRELLPIHARHVHAVLGVLPAKGRRDLRRLLGGLRDHLKRPVPDRKTKS